MSYSHLTSEERYVIFHLVLYGLRNFGDVLDYVDLEFRDGYTIVRLPIYLLVYPWGR